MHRGCFVWTPKPPLLGRRTPRPGPARVCVRALLGRVGRAGLPGALWCASAFPVAGLGALFVCSAPSGLGLPCLRLLLGFVFSFPFLCPCCLRLSVFADPGCLGPGRLVVLRPPPFFSSCAPLSPAFVGSRPGVPRALALCGPPVWPSSLLVFSPPPLRPPLFFLFSFFFRFCLFWFFFLFPCPGLPVVRFLGWFVCPGLWGVLVCVAVSLGAPWLCPFCVCCCLSRCVVVVCFVLCLVLCGVPVLGLVCAPRCCPSCRLLVPCRGPWLCTVLGCRAALLWCVASCAVCCCGAVLFLLRWLVLCGVACGCWLIAAVSGCLPLFHAGVCCRGCCCLAAWLAALLCAVVCCGAPLPCAVSCVLWCFVAVWCRAVAPCCPFSFAGAVGLCLFPVCAVLCCDARRVVRCRFGLRCYWCLVLWRVAVCCGVSLGVLGCAGAALVCCGPCCTVRCSVVSCALCCLLRCFAALRCCAGWLCCAVVCAAGVCFSFCPLFLC